MQLLEIFRLDEVHWSDIYPKAFAEFRKKYLKYIRDGRATKLYVQFSNYVDNTLNRNAYQTPDHSDPVGTYAYPMAYVLTHPADVWYGKSARYLRVLQDVSKTGLDLSYIDSPNKAIRLLQQMDFDYRQADQSLSLAIKHFKDRLKPPNKFAKVFLTAVQMDLVSPPIGKQEAGMWHKAGPIYRIRTGKEQTALFKKAGIDAIIDSSKNHKSAIINPREPEQIVFLTRNAFRVLEVFALRPGDQANYLASADVNPRSTRKLAAELAAIMDDKIVQSAEDPKLQKKIEFDATYRYFWTLKGRRIEVRFEHSAAYYKNKKMGEKKHKETKLYDTFKTKIDIETEIGRIERNYSEDETFNEILNQFSQTWNNLIKNPQPTNWKPQNAESFMAKIIAVKKQQREMENAARDAKLKKEWPQTLTDIQYCANYYHLHFTPNPQDINWYLPNMFGFFSNIVRHGDHKPEHVEHFVDEWYKATELWLDKGPYHDLMNQIHQLGPLIIAAGQDSIWWVNNREHMFGSLRAFLVEKQIQDNDNQ